CPALAGPRSGPPEGGHYMEMKSALERAADVEEHGVAIGEQPAAVMSPRRADRERERRDIAGHYIRRKLPADRGLDCRGAERPGPRVPGVGEQRAVQRVQEDRPRADAALRPRDRPAILGVGDRHARPREAVAPEAPQQAERLAVEARGVERRLVAAEPERAADRLVTVRHA